MADIHFKLAPELLQRFSNLAAGGFLVEDMDRAAAAVGNLGERSLTVRAALAARGLTVQNVASDRLVTGWRDAVASCELKPSTYKSSVEQLARRYLKGETIRTPLAVVNLYCSVSAGRLAPLGGYDLDRLPRREVVLRLGRPASDRFRPLAGRPEDMPIRPCVPMYASGDEVLCYAFNHRDSAETCLLATTKAAAFFSEAVTQEQRDAMEAALLDLSEALRSFGARPGPVVILDATTPEATLTL